ncbi:MAG: glycosyltransferase family 39 protein [Gemmataceae bacterium]
MTLQVNLVEATPTIAGRGEAPRSGVPALAVLLVAGLAVRLALWLAFRDAPITIWDEKDYDAIARTLVASGEFGFEPGQLVSLRPPLYPALVAVVYAVAGLGNFAAVRLLQILLSLATVGVVYALGATVASRRVALWAAGLCCFYPSLLGYNNLLLSETLFTLLLTGTCYCAVRAFQAGSVGWALAAGLALGLAALTRSVVWLTPPLLAGFLLLTMRVSWGRRLVAAVALVAGFVVVVGPWSVRNTRLQKTFVAVDVMGGRNFMMGNYRYTPLYRSWDAIALEGEQSWAHEVFMTYPPEDRPTQGFVDKLALKQGLAFVRANPGLTLKRDTIKFFDFWGLERELVAGAGAAHGGSLSKPALLGLTALIVGAYVTVLFLGVYGAFVAPPADRRALWLFLAVITYVCAMHTLTFGHSRYHLPLVPLIAVFAAGAITQARSIWRQRYRPAFVAATGVCAALVVGWVWLFVAVDWDLLAAALRS